MSTPTPQRTLWDIVAEEAQTATPPPPFEIACPMCAGHGRIVPSLAHARRSDLQTAREAGAAQEDSVRFHEGSRQARALREIASGPGTALAIAHRVLGADTPLARIEGMRRRVSSLARLGLVQDSGLRRANHGSTRLAIVWEITIAGREALVRLSRTGWSA